MQDFPANSAKARVRSEVPPQPDGAPKIEQVTSAEAVRRKRGIGRKFKETFIGGSARMAGEYMVAEVIIPAIQDTLIEAFQGGIERLFKGDRVSRRPVHNPNAYSNLGHVNYQGMSTGTRPPASSPRMLSRTSRARHDFGEIVIQSRAEADEVLERMYDVLSQYGSVTVGQLYALTGVEASHVDNKWGWTSLRGAGIDRLRQGGYALRLPPTESLG